MNHNTATSTHLVDSRIAFIGKTYGMLTLCIAAGSLGAYLSMGCRRHRLRPRRHAARRGT